jgi:hypothetical protein
MSDDLADQVATIGLDDPRNTAHFAQTLERRI